LEVVRPLRKNRRPMLKDLIEFDDVMKKCKDRFECPQLRNWLLKGHKVPMIKS
jgi:hypothetical protein